VLLVAEDAVLHVDLFGLGLFRSLVLLPLPLFLILLRLLLLKGENMYFQKTNWWGPMPLFLITDHTNNAYSIVMFP
jgi:hypothetical protein